MINFKVGDRVRCIDDKNSPLILNKIYTVKEIIKNFDEDCFPSSKNDQIILFEQPYLCIFYLDRFVKVDCLKNKIRKLKRLLKK